MFSFDIDTNSFENKSELYNKIIHKKYIKSGQLELAKKLTVKVKLHDFAQIMMMPFPTPKKSKIKFSEICKQTVENNDLQIEVFDAPATVQYWIMQNKKCFLRS